MFSNVYSLMHKQGFVLHHWVLGLHEVEMSLSSIIQRYDFIQACKHMLKWLGLAGMTYANMTMHTTIFHWEVSIISKEFTLFPCHKEHGPFQKPLSDAEDIVGMFMIEGKHWCIGLYIHRFTEVQHKTICLACSFAAFSLLIDLDLHVDDTGCFHANGITRSPALPASSALPALLALPNGVCFLLLTFLSLILRSGRCGQGAFFCRSQKKLSTQVSVPQKFHKGISHSYR